MGAEEIEKDETKLDLKLIENNMDDYSDSGLNKEGSNKKDKDKNLAVGERFDLMSTNRVIAFFAAIIMILLGVAGSLYKVNEERKDKELIEISNSVDKLASDLNQIKIDLAVIKVQINNNDNKAK